MLCKYGHPWCKGIAGSDDQQCSRCFSLAVFSRSMAPKPIAMAIKASSAPTTFETIMERLLAMDEPAKQKAYTLLYNAGCRIHH